MAIEKLLEKLKIINDFTGCEFYAHIGADNFLLARFNKHGDEDKIMDFESLDMLFVEINGLIEAAENKIYDLWWFE